MIDLYNSQTYGQLNLSGVLKKIACFIDESPRSNYRLIIGSDSQTKNGSGVDFITAIVIHRVGKGGIYFWKRRVEEKKMVLRLRIYKEALLSLDCAQEVVKNITNDDLFKLDLEIHVDVGNYGQTREMLSEVVGMIRGSGFNVKTKPEAFGASKVADRHT